MAQRPTWYAEQLGQLVIVTTGDGEVFTSACIHDFAELARAERAITWTDGSQLQVSLAELAITEGRKLDVALGRGDGIGLQLRGVWVDQAAILDRGMLLPDGAKRAELLELGGEILPAGRSSSVFEAEARTAELQAAMSSWRDRIVRVAQLQPKLSIGATAAGIVPRSWRKAAQLLQQNDEWSWVRQAYYGGRVECYRPGWEGNAVEYDLRAAYGWSLSQPIPDWKLYERRWVPVRDPAWLDCTVDVAGTPGPLPVRDDLGRLSWPTSGRWRGTWSRFDLEQPGVEIVEVHRHLAGRWSDDLRPEVSRWLELREQSASKADRVLLRLLCCSLAGKLCQRPIAWKLWRSSAEPPVGAMPLALNRGVWAIPSQPSRWPLTCPQAGSFVTARVRRRVRPALQHPACLYTDTDSAHYPADVAPPLQLGELAGDWCEKARGPARYSGIRQYAVGRKSVGNVVL